MRPGIFEFRATVKWEAWLGEFQNFALKVFPGDTDDFLAVLTNDVLTKDELYDEVSGRKEGCREGKGDARLHRAGQEAGEEVWTDDLILLL